MMKSYELSLKYDAEARTARSIGDYASAMVFTAAEDLTDGMLKGIVYEAGIVHLIEAFEANASIAYDEVERTAWHRAIAIAREF